MEAMILAAGLGTRLRPMTDTIPKALIDVGGKPMLERVARRLIDAGATRLVVNVHHHADLVRQFIASRDGFGVETVISDESDLLLDTGGALFHAAPLFSGRAPILLHNCDIETEIDLTALYRAHADSSTLATLAVMHRESARYLLFDGPGHLIGYGNAATGFEVRARVPVGDPVRLGFCGIHVISPRIFSLMSGSAFAAMTERRAFPIIPLYMNLVESGETIAGCQTGDVRWIDIGKPEQLALAREHAAERIDAAGARHPDSTPAQP